MNTFKFIQEVFSLILILVSFVIASIRETHLQFISFMLVMLYIKIIVKES